MSAGRPPFWMRPLVRAAALLAVIAYVPALTAAPGRMPADSKLYLYLDPGRLIADAAGSFDPRQFAGWVPHQHIAYLWPAGPWFWLFEALSVPDWIAHRLWLGTIMVAAGLGVRWCARLLGLSATAALAAAVVYQTSLYVLPYVSRTSVMLLPWAGLGWIVGFTIRATRRNTWGDPAAIALIVLTVGAVNATALAMIVPAPVLWLVHSAWQRLATWRRSVAVAMRVAVLSIGVSLWWIAMLLIQGEYGTDVLPYSESVADVSLTSTSAEVWRGLGYWLFYLRDPYAATTTESLRYLASAVALVVSFVIPIVCVAGLVWTRWTHRRFAALLIVTGVVLAVGVHPSNDRSPLMALLTGDGDGGLALALRSSTRAVPVLMLGLAIAAASLIDSVRPLRLPRLGLRRGVRADHVLATVVVVLAIVNLPALWTGAFVDPALERDQTAPAAWIEAASVLDRSGSEGRVLQLPGAEFGAYRWGYTVDQPLPGLTDKPLVTRDLLPLGSAGAMDLLFALDDRIQEGRLDPGALAPVARLLGVDTVWLTNDHAFDRFRTARPEIVRSLVLDEPGFAPPIGVGELALNRPEVPFTDERALGDPRVGQPMPTVELVELYDPAGVIRASEQSVLVSGSGDGLVDAAAAGLIDGTTTVRYSASLAGDPSALASAIDEAVAAIVTDSNRGRARHWRSSQDTTGFTEHIDTRLDPIEQVSGDQRLPVFDTSDPDTTTVAIQRGPVSAAATSYGEPFAYLPEHRPFMAIDGDPDTAWLVGEHGDPIGEMFRLYLDRDVDQIFVLQPNRPDTRRITELTVVGADSSGPIADITARIALDERSLVAPGQPIAVSPQIRSLDLTIETVGGGIPGTASAVSAVGFAEISSALGPATETIRPPTDVLLVADPDTPLAVSFTRLRVDPMNRWRDDPEPILVREFELSGSRRFEFSPTVRIDARASDTELAAALDWPAVASSRLIGSVRHAGVAAIDGDLDTAWITGFDEAEGATLSLAEVAQPLTEIAIRQPVSGFSRVTTLTLHSGDAARTIELIPDAQGGSRAFIDPPLPAGPLVVELSGIAPATTIDRRFGDVVELPAAISEIVIEGGPRVDRLGTTTHRFVCAPIAEIDGTSMSATVTVTGTGWLDGEPLTATPCQPSNDLDQGAHLLTSSPNDLPFTLDAVVLDAGARAAVRSVDNLARADVLEQGRFERQINVSGCPDGCWLVVGEGFNQAWSATLNGAALGDPEMVDGGFTGWWLAPDDGVRAVTVRWTAQRRLTIALIGSLLMTLLAILLIQDDRRRHGVVGLSDTGKRLIVPTWTWATERWSLRRSLLAGVLWITLSVLLIGPSWAFWGAVAASALLATRRSRLAELTALASLITVGAVVVLVERRDAPFPNGGWPTSFTSVHGIGMFAAVSILVAALVGDDADDADRDATSRIGETKRRVRA